MKHSTGSTLGRATFVSWVFRNQTYASVWVTKDPAGVRVCAGLSLDLSELLVSGGYKKNVTRAEGGL